LFLDALHLPSEGVERLQPFLGFRLRLEMKRSRDILVSVIIEKENRRVERRKKRRDDRKEKKTEEKRREGSGGLEKRGEEREVKKWKLVWVKGI